MAISANSVMSIGIGCRGKDQGTRTTQPQRLPLTQNPLYNMSRGDPPSPPPGPPPSPSRSFVINDVENTAWYVIETPMRYLAQTTSANKSQRTQRPREGTPCSSRSHGSELRRAFWYENWSWKRTPEGLEIHSTITNFGNE